MKALNIFGSCLCLVYLVAAILLHSFNPDAWPRAAFYIFGLAWGALVSLCLIIQHGIDKDHKAADKYFEDKSDE